MFVLGSLLFPASRETKFADVVFPCACNLNCHLICFLSDYATNTDLSHVRIS